MVAKSGAKYSFYWTGMKRKREYGVGILIKQMPSVEIGQIKHINERLMTADLLIFGLSVKITSNYAPHEKLKDYKKAEFYRALKKIVPENKNQKLLFTGDFNATTSAVFEHSCIRTCKSLIDITSNDNATRMIDFSRDNKLSILNTWFKHPKKRHLTWKSNDKWGTEKCLDYHLCSDYLRQYCTNTRAYHGFKFDSDHKLVISTWNTPITKRARYVKRKKSSTSPKFDLSGLRDHTLTEQFKNAVDVTLATMQHDSTNLDNIYESIVSCLNKAAAASLPKSSKPTHHKPVWSTDQIFQNLLSQRSKTHRDNQCTKFLTKKIRKRAQLLKNQHFRKEAIEIEALREKKDFRAMYVKAKAQTTTFKPIRVTLDPDKGHVFFEQHFNPTAPTPEQTPPELLKPPKFTENLKNITEKVFLDSSAPTLDDIRLCLIRLKLNKSSCDVPPEFLKAAAASPEFISCFKTLTDEVWASKKVPTSFGHGRLEALFKNKGSNKEAKNYRGLNIGSCVAKTVISIILDRLKPWYIKQLSYHQCGFRPGLGTTDATYVLKRAMQISVRKMEPLYLIFCDLSAAFDHCVRKWLFESIRMRFPDDADTTLIDILENLYENTSCDLEGNTFKTTAGVRQGGPESPWLYTLFADFVMRVFLDRCALHPKIQFFKHKYHITSKNVPNEFESPAQFEQFLAWLGYADDTVLLLSNDEALQLVYDIYESTLTDFFLKVNPTKTKTQVCSFKNTPNYTPETEYPTSIISATKGAESEAIENIEVMTYLGVQFKSDEPGTGWTEIENRIDSAKTQFAIRKNLFQNHSLSLHLRIQFLNSLARSRLTYGCQNWALTKAQYDKLDSTYRIMLRRMIKGGCRKRKNDENPAEAMKFFYDSNKIHEICQTEDISGYVKRQQRNYAAHIIRTSSAEPTKQFMFNNDKYRKPGQHAPELLQQVVKQSGVTKLEFISQAASRKF